MFTPSHGRSKFEQDLNDMEARPTAEMALRYQGVIVGIKTAHYAGPEFTPVERAVVESFCFGIEPWSSKRVETELRKRGLTPIAENDGHGFESFHVKDPDGFDVQISNGNKGSKTTR